MEAATKDNSQGDSSLSAQDKGKYSFNDKDLDVLLFRTDGCFKIVGG